MTLSKSEKDVIFSNINEISELFNVSEERELLQQHFSVADIEECLQEGESRYVQTATLCMTMVKRRNKDFFDALSQHFLKRSVQYKKMYEKMCSGVDVRSREDRVGKALSKSEGSQNEMSRGDRCTAQHTQSSNLSDHKMEKNVDLNSMEMTVHDWREKIRQLEEERDFWRRQSASETEVVAEMKRLLKEVHEMMKERLDPVEPAESRSAAAQCSPSTSKDSATQTDRGVQLFQYSDGARRRAEVETFSGCNMRCILCSASGLFNVETGELGGGVDWSAQWRMLVGGRGGGLGGYLMMPHPVDNLVVLMWLVRRDDTLLIQTRYHKRDQRGNAPSQFTIDCEVSVIIENKDGTSTTRSQQKQHKITLVGDLSLSDFVTFPVPDWGVVNPQKPPTVKIQLINVEL